MPVEKRKLDEKTYELYNTGPYLGNTPITQAAVDAQADIHSGARAAGMFEEMMRGEQRVQEIERHQIKGSEGGWNKATSVDDFLQAAKEASPEQRNAWRKQFSNLDKGLKKNPDHQFAVEGIQEMLDTGAIYMDDDGNVYSSVPGRGGPKRNDRLLDAAGNWGDWYRDKMAGTAGGLASQEMDNTVRSFGQEWKYDPASGGYTR